MSPQVTIEEWRLLLKLVLAQRLEINAIESALKRSGTITDGEIKEIRRQNDLHQDVEPELVSIGEKRL